ncbi:MAG: putative lipoprotein [Methylococcaceae bacterium]
MPNLRALLLPALTLCLAVNGAGCSFSDSSASLSGSVESSASSSGSSSESSSGRDSVSAEKAPYRDDVANLTFSVAGSAMTASDFPTALSRTANQFKISDWRSEKATYYGIGKGLKKAGIPVTGINSQAFLTNVLTANKDALRWIQAGYKN